MIFNIDFETVLNIENKIQISIARNTKAGQKIVAESLDEFPKDAAGNEISTVHPEKSYLHKNPDNYFLMKGGIKLWYKWQDGDPFQSSNVSDYTALQESLTPDFVTKVNQTTTSDTISAHMTYNPIANSGFKDSIMEWRPKVSETGLEILSDNTILLCPMQHASGWTFKQADLLNSASIEITKQGTDCYFLSTEEVTTDSKTIDGLSLKKLTSSSVTITNNSGTFTKVILIYK